MKTEIKGNAIEKQKKSDDLQPETMRMQKTRVTMESKVKKNCKN